eukprot:TRINITY_DN313_c0_g1_i1.p1 TRINITY_DN313_c0_g1~~TRINITY_DN313_c0_g1_i1.p1  ORF type:complete len:607 (-),score=68.39 TRINITY_DN313_c0_g1_i1:75-1829(-)
MQKTTLFLLGILALAGIIELISAQQCPNNCSSHGTCQNGVCECSVGWGDLDCSISATALNPPTHLANQEVNIREWKFYYTHATSSSGEIKWVVQSATTNSGDVDIFVQKDRFPTRSDYLARNITTAASFELAYTPTATGVYYVGIYAFFGRPSVTYNISVSTVNTCNCHGHGICVGPEQVCECFTGYAGEYCEDVVTRLDAGTHSTSGIEIGKWKYYRFEMQVQNAFVVVVNQTQSNTDVDLFVKFNNPPSQWSYDYADRTLAKDTAIEVETNNRHGWWYIGVYGFTAATFTVYWEPFSDCPSDCSKHGNCNARGGCTCHIGYTGVYCETKTAALTNNELATGMVADNSWNFYHIQPNSIAALVVSMTQVKKNEDCDLYVRRGQNPTLLDFDARNVSIGSNSTVRIDDGQFDTWYIGIFGFTLCEYTLVVGVSEQCPPCGAHGHCDTAVGECICNTGWTGTYCNYFVSTITNFTTVHSGDNMRGEWKYYQVNLAAGTLFTAHLLETRTEGYFWLFVSDKQPPTLTDYNADWTDKESNTDHHAVTFTVPNSGMYYIGIYGSPFGMGPDTTSYPWELQVWDSPFRK